ncbi:MAG: glycosyltransferase family A protein [Albidovulum sp.]|uniref:glycosyltransferase family 2 protein n=1 Tax=Albidovulum sp. TaxID=1872424 RepID=UPI003CA16AC8
MPDNLPPEPLVQIRTPTYRRPEALERCLRSLQAQSWRNWVCDVFDDDPDGGGAAVVAALADGRIHYHHNRPQLFASKNIDACFSRQNPRGADYFCVVEDDNFILPDFIAANIALCQLEGVEVILRNQVIEYASGTGAARISTFGILDRKFVEGRYAPDRFRLALMADIGVSNGGLFWSARAASDFEVGFPISATLQEYIRTYALQDDIHVAMEPLAVWAENGSETTRDLGAKAGYYRRELNLKRSIVELQRRAWRRAPVTDRAEFLHSPVFAYSPQARANGLVKSLTRFSVEGALPLRARRRLLLRGGLIRIAGRMAPGRKRFIAANGA